MPAALTFAVSLLLTLGCVASPITARAPASPPNSTGTDAVISDRVEAILDTLSLERKVGQLLVTHAAGTSAGLSRSERRRLESLVEDIGIGGVIFFKGDRRRQVRLTRRLQSQAALPLLIASDMEHGPGMRLTDGTSYPSAMALGATRSPALAYRMGRAVADEARAMGVHQNYAPVADVNNNPRNPIINTRSYGEDPQLVGALAEAYVRGMQDGGLIATAKHFPGHGDTAVDSHAGLPALPFGVRRLQRLELRPFRQLVDAGVKSVMMGHLAVRSLDESGVPASLSPTITTGWLRDRLGFGGLIVTDGLDMHGVRAQLSAGETAVRAFLAGSDLLILTRAEAEAHDALMNALATGRLDESRVDASVRRVLRAKAEAGLLNGSAPTPAIPPPSLNRRADALAKQMARQAITVIQPTTADPLPFVGTRMPHRLTALVLDDGADNRTGQPFLEQVVQHLPPGAELRSRRLDEETPDAEIERALDDAERADAVVIGTFNRIRSWSGRIGLPDRLVKILKAVIATGRPVVLVAFGNPYVAADVPLTDAYVATYDTAPVVQRAAADALFGAAAVSGRLPVSVPGRYQFGSGETIPQQTPRLGSAIEAGLAPETGAAVDQLIKDAIEDGAFPGAAVAIGRGGVLVRMRGYGHLTPGGADVTADTPYDLASLTKVLATTTLTMQLVEEGRLRLDAPVATYLPEYGRQREKQAITVRQLLTHSAGHRPFYPFYREGIEETEEVLDFIAGDALQYRPGTRINYSDFDMIVLGAVIERVTGRPLDVAFAERIAEPLNLNTTGFRDVGVVDSSVAPTENDRTWRGRVLQGEVHDEAASVMGGVAGHAGLFSSARDLAALGFAFAHQGQARGTRLVEPTTLATFTQRVDLPGDYPMGLGWMLRPTDAGDPSSSGDYFGPHSFGHTGFTGTSIWVDPDEDLFVILLTNRVHPTRENRLISQVRARLADAVASRIEAPLGNPADGLGFGTVPPDLLALPVSSSGM